MAAATQCKAMLALPSMDADTRCKAMLALPSMDEATKCKAMLALPSREKKSLPAERSGKATAPLITFKCGLKVGPSLDPLGGPTKGLTQNIAPKGDLSGQGKPFMSTTPDGSHKRLATGLLAPFGGPTTVGPS